MKLYCRDGIVIATHDDDQDVPASAYGDGIVIVYSATAVATDSPVPTLDHAGLKACAREKRKSVIAGGCTVTVDGIAMPVWADADTISALTGLSLMASANPALTASWKARDGQFYDLNAADITTLATGVATFVQAAFAAESAVVADIDADNITTADEIEAADWPT